MTAKDSTMCIEEAIARMNVLKDKATSSAMCLETHSMMTTLLLLRGLGFKRVALTEV
jgi:hypothetical protein